MTIFAMGFIFIMLFTVAIGIGAIVFVSIDTVNSHASLDDTENRSQGYDIVRQINTNTIETVNPQGIIQRWQRSNEQHQGII